jgi:hypothetical protein
MRRRNNGPDANVQAVIFNPGRQATPRSSLTTSTPEVRIKYDRHTETVQ